MKPIPSLLLDDDEFKYILEMGERAKYILLINNKIHNEAKINENKYKSILKKMKTIADDANMKDSARTCILVETSVEVEELLKNLAEYKTPSKEISKTRIK